ncbi:MAG: nucleolar GTP-binding protein 1 [Amphiamblys sp. WSBS2006]|nr:MAG: nucleolar GTP-binding protein 1 [Amphiamblys sp. WSBS2006]
MAENCNFRDIQTVLKYNELVDIVLSKTQRKTPTVIRKGKEISTIREFYTRKVKFTQETFDEKLGNILTGFPRLDAIHPFYGDLLNVLYDRDHYKIALGQISGAKRQIESVSKEYVRLLKYGDSLYRCKRLKIAALGRMVKIMKKHKDALVYLEQIRQHMSRLPVIDPNTRTLVLCGLPNVGKSSFMNKITRADVDVQAYPFTTKSLYVGHMDYGYLRWQVIDTPGILDRPLEERNTIEMQAVTALAHLRSAVLYFIDVSETCGYSIAQQVSLFNSLRPLFASKKLVVVFSKTDLATVDSLGVEDRALLAQILDGQHQTAMLSSQKEDGVFETRNIACDLLLEARVDQKAGKAASVMNRLRVSRPDGMDPASREPHIPGNYRERVEIEEVERDIELKHGGAGVYSIDLKKKYLLPENEKYDVIPEICNGKNIADFVDPLLEEKLAQIEIEEDYLQRTGAYDIEPVDDETKNVRHIADMIERRRGAFMEKKKLENRGTDAAVKRKLQKIRKDPETERDTAEDGLSEMRQRLLSKAQKTGTVSTGTQISLMGSGPVSVSGNVRDRRLLGIGSEKDLVRVNRILKLVHRKRRMLGKKGEGDNEIPDKKPKHMFSGKMGRGKRNRR